MIDTLKFAQCVGGQIRRASRSQIPAARSRRARRDDDLTCSGLAIFVHLSMAEGSGHGVESSRRDIGLKTVVLLKDQNLGIGGYGAVCKAKCDDRLVCAAKILHPTLFDPLAHQQIARRREHRLPIKRFEQECEFMSAIRHPNIVQYLGSHEDPETGLPVLLMELMDDSLTHFVESSTYPIPYHIQVNFCHDIASALSFLHANSIVHRDLSGNNVLLIGSVRAKVTDFGMARLGELTPRASHLTFTMCPGMDVYMPPEAVQVQPVYNEKVDCFSFGVVIVQMLSRQFPKPGDRLKKVCTNDPQFHGGEVEVRVPEIERRENHISQIDHNQPLLQIALNCLKDNDNERPSAQQLQEQIAALKESREYGESARPVEEILSEKEQQIQEAQVTMQSLNEEIESKNELIRARDQDLLSKNETIELLEEGKAQLQSQLQQQVLTVLQKDQAIAEKDEAVDILQVEKAQLQTRLEAQQQAHGEIVSRRNQVISANETVIAENHRLVGELRSTISGNEEVIASKDRQIGELRSTISGNEEVITAKDQMIGELRSTISGNEEVIASKDQLIGELKSTISGNEEVIAAKDQLIGELRRTSSGLKETISEKNREISEFDNERKLFSFNGRNTTQGMVSWT